MSSLAGIFLALVPINDQPADKFIKITSKLLLSPPKEHGLVEMIQEAE